MWNVLQCLLYSEGLKEELTINSWNVCVLLGWRTSLLSWRSSTSSLNSSFRRWRSSLRQKMRITTVLFKTGSKKSGWNKWVANGIPCWEQSRQKHSTQSPDPEQGFTWGVHDLLHLNSPKKSEGGEEIWLMPVHGKQWFLPSLSKSIISLYSYFLLSTRYWE